MSTAKAGQPIAIRYADLAAARKAGETWPAIRDRYNGVAITTLRRIFKARADCHVQPRRRRKTAAAALEIVNEVLADAEPEASLVDYAHAFAERLRMLAVKRCVIDLESGHVEITRAERYPIGGGR